jgi:hypothetical protein
MLPEADEIFSPKTSPAATDVVHVLTAEAAPAPAVLLLIAIGADALILFDDVGIFGDDVVGGAVLAIFHTSTSIEPELPSPMMAQPVMVPL